MPQVRMLVEELALIKVTSSSSFSNNKEEVAVDREVENVRISSSISVAKTLAEIAWAVVEVVSKISLKLSVLSSEALAWVEVVSNRVAKGEVSVKNNSKDNSSRRQKVHKSRNYSLKMTRTLRSPKLMPKDLHPESKMISYWYYSTKVTHCRRSRLTLIRSYQLK
jgi:hypothetical protein